MFERHGVQRCECVCVHSQDNSEGRAGSRNWFVLQMNRQTQMAGRKVTEG